MGFFDFLFGGKSASAVQPSAPEVRYDKDNVYDVVFALTVLAMAVGDSHIYVELCDASQFKNAPTGKIRVVASIDNLNLALNHAPKDIARFINSVPFEKEQKTTDLLIYDFKNYSGSPSSYKSGIIAAFHKGQSMSRFSGVRNIRIQDYPGIMDCYVD